MQETPPLRNIRNTTLPSNVSFMEQSKAAVDAKPGTIEDELTEQAAPEHNLIGNLGLSKLHDHHDVAENIKQSTDGEHSRSSSRDAGSRFTTPPSELVTSDDKNEEPIKPELEIVTNHMKEAYGAEKDVDSATTTDPKPASEDTPESTEPEEIATKEIAINGHKRTKSTLHRHVTSPSSGSIMGISEYSHQVMTRTTHEEEEDEDDGGGWQDMPAYATFDMYDDDGKLIAKEADFAALGGDSGAGDGAGRGYTRVQMDEDAQSATSMDDNTAYLFKEPAHGTTAVYEEEEGDQRDPLSQMDATKHLLTENQRIAYVGVVRLAMAALLKDLQSLERSRGTKKAIDNSTESMKMWSQKMMVRLYTHMELSSAEQIMIEQLADHGLQADDLTPSLMQNARVKNPMKDDDASTLYSKTDVSTEADIMSPVTLSDVEKANTETEIQTPATELSFASRDKGSNDETLRYDKELGNVRDSLEVPPPYKEIPDSDSIDVRTPSQLPNTAKIDIDLRWTVLCDLFLVLIIDAVYDSRSRALLERVGDFMKVPWIDICRFEKRVTDALEMQQEASKEDWNEAEHIESRRKRARNRRLVMMGLATVGGGLVIGLSAGLLAPVIGAGLAAGFTTIGISGTGTFLAGAGGAAVIGTAATVTGGTIGVRAANRRTGAVKTFEYRPLHNNKRVNLIVTVAGWMTSKVDDVRLPFSTVDPVMGDIYSILWEPEMLTSMGDTINILATEALTQGLQQILGSTILVALMAALQLPVVLTKLSYLIDNPWSVSIARADLAGLILADSLIDRNLGARPVTLVGYSLGSRVIYSCLQELAKRGAVGLIQNVYIFGSPVVVKKDEFIRAQTIVSGRFVNGYCTNDWILGYLFRATGGGIMRVAGLAQVDIPGIENFDATEFVPGHMSYRKAIPKIMRRLGWTVESDEFSEIEDPDPDNHERRQRELINEIEEARQELQKKPEKRRFGLFRKNWKAAEKKDWETYDERSQANPDPDPEMAHGNAIFDIDAIRREAVELAAEGIEIKELRSTMPKMIIDTSNASSSENVTLPRPSMAHREVKSFAATYQGLSPHPNGVMAKPASISASLEDSRQDIETPDEGDITMSFEPIPSPTHITQPYPPRSSSKSPEPTSLTKTDSHLNETARDQTPTPETGTFMPSHASKPSYAEQIPVNLDRNVWADEEEGFGEEREMELTFE